MKNLTYRILLILLLAAGTAMAGGYNRYQLKKDYRTAGELMAAFIDPGLRSTDHLFNWCCDCILFLARTAGMSYEEMNILLFVILQPTIILILVLLYLRERRLRRRLQGN